MTDYNSAIMPFLLNKQLYTISRLKPTGCDSTKVIIIQLTHSNSTSLFPSHFNVSKSKSTCTYLDVPLCVTIISNFMAFQKILKPACRTTKIDLYCYSTSFAVKVTVAEGSKHLNALNIGMWQ